MHENIYYLLRFFDLTVAFFYFFILTYFKSLTRPFPLFGGRRKLMLLQNSCQIKDHMDGWEARPAWLPLINTEVLRKSCLIINILIIQSRKDLALEVWKNDEAEFCRLSGQNFAFQLLSLKKLKSRGHWVHFLTVQKKQR